eukprot:TRINITY_DN80628_c0_g1_i1.p1 TRINITY_DN80628_c0_g1~~TRINITY_DN80628_c0_g1_i1.p1  ORF type:complete len:638 (+),score=176.89 TRINITY_DN80628_c0_g1_i1:243-2156(+)
MTVAFAALGAPPVGLGAPPRGVRANVAPPAERQPGTMTLGGASGSTSRGTSSGASSLLSQSCAVGGGLLLLASDRRRFAEPSRRSRRSKAVRQAAAPTDANGVPLGNIFNAASMGMGGAVGIGGPPGMPGMPGMPGYGEPQMTTEEAQAREQTMQEIRNFAKRPREVKSFLDRFVIEQDEAKKVLSVAFCDHYNWARRCLNDSSAKDANYTKPNILLLGPTGSGKTYLVRTLAKMIGVPFVTADATKFSETGIVGEDAEDVVRSLVDAANGDTELAQYGIVYIDEVDKIAAGGRGGSGGYNGRQVQSNFLKIMEASEVSTKNAIQSQLGGMLPPGMGGGGEAKTISTKFILFIFSGAFTSLADIVKDRVGKKSIGFVFEDDALGNAEENHSAVSNGHTIPTPKEENYLQLAETKDFVQVGLMPEFIGRVPVRVAINELDSDILYRILTEAEDSILRQAENEFQGYGIGLKCEEAALRSVAKMAQAEKTGARALVTILEKKLREFKYELPSTGCTELVVTEGLIDDPKKTLMNMLSSADVAAKDVEYWIKQQELSYKIRLQIADDVVECILKECEEKGTSAESILNARFRATRVVEGFKDIFEATGGSVDIFTLNMAMYERPQEEIEKWTASLKSVKA